MVGRAQRRQGGLLIDMSFGSGPLRVLTMSVLLAIALGGCTTSLPEKQYTNTGYDDENYDLRLC